MTETDSSRSSQKRGIAFAVALALLAVKEGLNLPLHSSPALLAYALFFVACLMLTRTAKGFWRGTVLFTLLMAATLAADAWALKLAAQLPQAMLSMQVMMLVTVVQNVLISCYLLLAVGLLIKRESVWMVKLLGLAVAGVIAVRILPATFFTLAFLGQVVG